VVGELADLIADEFGHKFYMWKVEIEDVKTRYAFEQQ
jgi:hypothetical protein